MTLALAKSFTARFWNDQHGFVVSAELILVATIAVLSMVVGLSEVAFNINNELEDVGSAFGSLSQRYCVQGTRGHKGHTGGSQFKDSSDFCDGTCDIQCGDTSGEY
jgi:Flp pilus assembly pilin Flp